MTASQAAAAVIEGLLEIAHHALPDSFWQTDNRIEAARELLGQGMPSDQELERRFQERISGE